MELMEEIKLICAYIITTWQAGSILPQKNFHCSGSDTHYLWRELLRTCALVQVLDKKFTVMHSENHQVRSGKEDVAPWVCRTGRQAPLTDWDVICEWGIPLPRPTDIVPIREEKKFPLNHIVFHFLHDIRSIIRLWDHGCICGPSLTETSLYGAWL